MYYPLDKKLLFRYRNISDYSINELLKDEFVLSSTDTFNDSHDLAIGYNLDSISNAFISDNSFIRQMAIDTKRTQTFQERYEYLKSKKGQHVITEYLNILSADAIKYFKTKILVGCFSKDCTNQAMWSHYADFGKGFIVGYEEKKIIESIKDTGNYKIGDLLNDVEYKQKVLDASQMLIQAIKDAIYNKNFYTYPDRFVEILVDSNDKNYDYLLYKNPYWRYEKERRIIILNKKQNANSHIAISHLKPDVVILGENISFKDKYLLISICKNKSIPIFVTECSLKENKFELYVRPLLPIEIEDVIQKSSDILHLDGLII